jgi:adenosylcobyric acid synthase
VIAQIVGTQVVIAPEDAALVAGFLVNRFRGDPTLCEAGLKAIAERSGWPSLGLFPYFPDAARLPAEDALALDQRDAPKDAPVTIAVLQLPRISNFDDFDPLKAEPGVRLVFVRRGQTIPVEAQLVVIPGSKATIADLRALREEGWHIDLAAHVRRGGKVMGVCGGYQMLGRSIDDPRGIEGEAGGCEGLGLLDVSTVMQASKTLEQVSGRCLTEGAPFTGYEMHIGRTEGPDTGRPLLEMADGRREGASSADGRLRGVYVHGLFNDDRQRRAWLNWIGASASDFAYEQGVEDTLDALAAHLERHVDCDRLLSLAR